MTGGAGDDTYYLKSPTDRAVELAGGGIDKIVAWSSVYLPNFANVENLEVNGDKTYGAGGAGDNIIQGGAGSQQIYGGGGQDILIGSADFELDDLYHRDHFRRDLRLKQWNRHLISRKDNMADSLFAHNPEQAFDNLFGMLVVRVADAPLVAGLRPATDLHPMSRPAFHVFRFGGLTKPEDEDSRRVRIG